MPKRYNKATRAETRQWVRKFNPLFDKVSLDPDQTEILYCRLPFYPEGCIYELKDHSFQPPAERRVLAGGDETAVLDGTAEKILNVNAAAPLLLTLKNLPEYIRFYFQYVRFGAEPVQIVETLDDISWLEEPQQGARDMVRKLVSPLRSLSAPDSQGFYRIEGCLLSTGQGPHSACLYSAVFSVDAQGRVRPDPEQTEILVEDLAVIRHASGSVT